ncbi:flagellar motor switch protein FliN [Croceibacterium sp. TMG7-5b_MA50]|uniref:flagellar motor switch protein FliN n=1 Tax=Croceibacterium sp. TMG7-5b_MA50 TaxID=3121290 RepID=UPI003221CD6B
MSIVDGFGLIQDIDVRLTVELGRTQMRLRDVLALAEDSVVRLDRLVDEPLDVMVNGKLIARGEVVAEGNRFGLRILELVSAAPPATPATAPEIEAKVPRAAGARAAKG